MYHNSHQFGKAYQEEMLRQAGVKGENGSEGPIVRRKVVRAGTSTNTSDSKGNRQVSPVGRLGGLGALSGLVLLALFLAMVASRIM